jgi:hypothetical protein
MDLFVLMEVDEAFEDGLEYGGDFVLREFFLSDIEKINDAAGVAVLEDDPEIVVLEVGAVVFNDVLVVAQSQDLDFLFYGVYLGQAGRR